MTATGAATPGTVAVVALEPADFEAAIPGLAALILDAVADGTGVNFLAGATDAEARAWWEERRQQVADGTITAFIARRGDDSAILGSAILIRSRNQNAPHRAEVGKVIVHQTVRRHGLARALMQALEDRARREGRWLLILDTVAGSAADSLYRSLGWTVLGVMPNHAYLPDGELADTTYFWKDLR
jgi:GNAT superfamily N-acetyltransferase